MNAVGFDTTHIYSFGHGKGYVAGSTTDDIDVTSDYVTPHGESKLLKAQSHWP